MAEQLKPCPFCGGKAQINVCDRAGLFHGRIGMVSIRGRQMTHKMILCEKCGAKTKAYLTDIGVFNAWNRRAEAPQEETIKEIARFMAKKDWHRRAQDDSN